MIRPDLRERRDSTLEQAALPRIATLVAQGAQPHELFAVVAEEVVADTVRIRGMRSNVGVPIVVAGRVWGAIVASNTERLPKTPELVSPSSRSCSQR